MKKFVNFIIENYIIFCVYALIGWLYEVSLILIRNHEFVNRGVLFGPFLPIYGFGILILLLILKKFMSHKHLACNLICSTISIFTIVTFIAITVIEYTHDKIFRVDIFWQHYGILLILLNFVSIIVINLFIQKNNTLKNIDLTPILVFLIIWIVTTLVEYIGHYMTYELSHKMLWDYSKDFLNINRRVNWDASRNFAIGGTLLLYTVQPLLNKFFKKVNFNIKLIISLCIGIPMLIDLIINVII